MMWSGSTILLETNGIDASIKKRKVTHTRCAYEITMLPWKTSLSLIFNKPQDYQFLIYIDYFYLAKALDGYYDHIFIFSDAKEEPLCHSEASFCSHHGRKWRETAGELCSFIWVESSLTRICMLEGTLVSYLWVKPDGVARKAKLFYKLHSRWRANNSFSPMINLNLPITKNLFVLL